MKLIDKSEKFFPQISLFVLFFNYVFRYYYNLNSVMQFIITIWGLIIIYTKYKDHSFFIKTSLIITGLFFLVYIFKGSLTVAWTYFVKIICIFIFMNILSKEKIESYFTIFSEVILCYSISILLITFLSMLFINENSTIPIILKHFESNLYECALSQHYSDRYIGFFGNSNKSAIFSSICIFADVYLIISRNKKSPLSYISIILNLAIIYATKSRGTILTVCLFFLLLPIIFIIYSFNSYSKNTRKKLIITLILLIFIIFVVAIICLLSPSLYSFFANVFRFTVPENPTIQNKISSIINSLTDGSGRNELMTINYNLFKKSPIIGVSYPELYNAAPNLVHNGFIFTLFLLGIPVFCISILIIFIISINPIIKSYTYRDDYSKKELILISATITIIICCFFYNCFEILIVPISNDGYSIIFLVCSGALFNLTRKRNAK